jgi:YVTN family beta-propeller protein/parallel beta-helix repeat protein
LERSLGSKVVGRLALAVMLIMAALCLSAGPATAQTPISGTLTEDFTMVLANSPYVVSGESLSVNAGVTLTIEPGVVVKFGQNMGLHVSGILNVTGTSGNVIHFTDYRDDSVGGDTNGDGAATSPAAGWWTGIHVYDGASATLSYTSVRYTGSFYSLSVGKSGAGGSLSITNSTISDGVGNGVQIDGSTADHTISGNVIENNTGAGISLSGDSGTVTVSGNTIRNNGSAALRATESRIPVWGGNTCSGNQYNAIQVYGSVSSDFTLPQSGSPYVVGNWESLSVNAGVTLTIEPGVVVKFGQSTGLGVSGILNATGTSGNVIHFTDYRDDSVGGDTNGDGAATSPAAGWWTGIHVYDGASATLSYTSVRYTGSFYSLSVGKSGAGGSLSIANSTISDGIGNGVQIDASTANHTVSGNVIESNTGAGISLSGDSGVITVSGNTIRNNGAAAVRTTDSRIPAWDGNACSGNLYNAIQVSGSVSSDLTLPQSGSPYVVGNVESLSVNAGVTLTIEPGVAVKFDQNAGLSVSGTLNAVGSSGSEIRFTDYRDDSVGGDTNGDGAATSPAAGWWTGIHVYDGASATLSYTSVRYTGSFYNLSVGKSGAGGSLSITNSTISDGAGHGVQIDGSTADHTISGNVIENNTGAGISLSGDSGTVTVSGNTIRNNGADGIFLQGAGNSVAIHRNTVYANTVGISCGSSSNPVIGGSLANGNNILGNTTYGVQNTDPGVTVNARYNYWGSSTGPYHPVTNLAGTGNEVSNYVDYGNLSPDPYDAGVPVVTVSATDPTATEAGLTTGQFTVTRSGSTAADLTVQYTVGGSATPTSDYAALSGSVTILAGSSTATITVTPVDDTDAEGDETVVATLGADAAYAVGAPASATVTITSDDYVPGPSICVMVSHVWIEVSDFPPATSVTVSVNDGAKGSQTVTTDGSGLSRIDWWGLGAANRPLPGDRVTAQYGLNVVEMTVQALEGTPDPAGNSVSGTVRTPGGTPIPGRSVSVSVHSADWTNWFATAGSTTDGSGNFTVDISPFDLALGHGITLTYFDAANGSAAGNRTVIAVYNGIPSLSVAAGMNFISGQYFPYDASITVSVNDGGKGTAQTTADPWGTFSPLNWWTQGGTNRILPGDKVTAVYGMNPADKVEMIVQNVQAVADTSANVVTGTALTPAGSPLAGVVVDVSVNSPDWQTYLAYASTTTDGNGNFSLDLTSFDLVPGQGVWLRVFDTTDWTGNQTMTEVYNGIPALDVALPQNCVGGDGLPFNAQVSISVNDGAKGTTPATTDDAGNLACVDWWQQGSANRILVGDKVSLVYGPDPADKVEMIVQDLAGVADTATNLVTGTARTPGGSPLAGRAVSISGSAPDWTWITGATGTTGLDGSFSFDFGAMTPALDLVPGQMILVSVYDAPDGSPTGSRSTILVYNGIPILGAQSDGDWIQGSGFPPDTEVGVSLNGGAKFSAPVSTDPWGNFNVNLWLQGINLEPGDTFAASFGARMVSMVVHNIQASTDVVTNVIAGTAFYGNSTAPLSGEQISVNIFTSWTQIVPDVQLGTLIGPAGGFQVDFTGTRDVGRGDCISITHTSPEGHQTMREVTIPAISGTVRAKDTGVGVPNVGVVLSSGSGAAAANAWTDADGNYSLANLNPGAYKLSFDANGYNGEHNTRYRTEWYQDKSEIDTASWVVVNPNGAVQVLNADLENTGGGVAGRVTGDGGLPLAGVSVCFQTASWSASLFSFAGCAQTGGNGWYFMSGIKPGSYKVLFFPKTYNDSHGTGYALQWYGPVVTVVQGQTTQPVDGQLVAGGAITGTVTGAGGVPLAGVTVRIRNVNLKFEGNSVPTDANGVYVMTGLPAGSFKLHFNPGAMNTANDTDYVGEWYGHQPAFESATPVRVVVGATRRGIDARLATGGRISGQVLGAGGSVLSGIQVRAYAAADAVGVAGEAVAGFGPRYVIRGLAPGSYRVSFDPTMHNQTTGATYLAEWHADRNSYETANIVAVAEGADVSVDASLGTGDGVPNQFTFVDQAGVALNTTVTSNQVAVSGLSDASPVFIVGGEYSVNGGAYRSAPWTVTNGDLVAVRLTSAGNSNTTVDATLVIGAVSDTFSVTTRFAPTVTIIAADPTATEAGPTPGQLSVTRIGSTTAALTVTYTVGGTATAGIDYVALPGSVTIPAGANAATITVTPLNDEVAENEETVLVKLGAATDYEVGIASSATVTITSDDFVPRLPDSDQRKCYQAVTPYAEIPCAGTGQDGEYVQSPLSYTDNNNGTVTDNNTGLVWQKQDDGSGYNWFRASGTYDAARNPGTIDVCGSLVLGGASDWRLPTRKELMSLVDYAIQGPGPALNETYFPGAGQSSYWSITTATFAPDSAGVVDFGSGSLSLTSKASPAYVRCVRGVQLSAGALVSNDDGTVTDHDTGLIWQQDEPGAMVWGDALTYCGGLSLGGGVDWRLPNAKELASLAGDTTISRPTDPMFFPNASPSPYWSSTTYASSPLAAWCFDFADRNLFGWSKSGAPAALHAVRCVRGGQSGLLTDTPDRFVFLDQTGIAPSTLVVSNPIAVTGLQAVAPVSVAGGEYSVNGGTFTSVPGEVATGDQVRVRVISAASYATRAEATLTIGGVSDIFSVTTMVEPTVSISAVDDSATELGPTTGQFQVTRTGSTIYPLPIGYTVTGTATAGNDYTALSGSVTIRAGETTATIVVTPVNDGVVEGDETVVATLSPDPGYGLGAPASATVTIFFASTAEARGGSYAKSTIDLDPGKILGANPEAVGFNTITKKVYVASSNGVLSVYNGVTDSYLGAVRFGDGGYARVFDLVVDSVLNKVYVAANDGHFTIVDGGSDTVAARLPIGPGQRVAVHPTNGRVYVSQLGPDGDPMINKVFVVNAATNSLEATVTVGVNPVGIGILGDKVYVANAGSGTVSVIDANFASPRFNTVVATIAISSALANWGPAEVSVNGGTNTVYVLCRGNVQQGVQSSLAVIDGATSALKFLGGKTNPVVLPGTCWSNGLGVRRSNNKVAVRNTTSCTGQDLHTFSTWNAITQEWEEFTSPAPDQDLGDPITAWTRNEARQRIYLLAGAQIHVLDIDPASPDFNRVIAVLPSLFDTENMRALALGDADDTLFAAGGSLDHVAVFDLAGNTLRHTHYPGGGPQSILFDSGRNTAWVAHSGGGLDGNRGVRRLDGATQVATSVDTGTGVGLMALPMESVNRVYTFGILTDVMGLVPIDGETNVAAPTIPLPLYGFNDVKRSEITKRIYLAFENQGIGQLAVVNVDPESPGFDEVEANLTLATGAVQATVNEADNVIYVLLSDSRIAVVNGATNTFVSNIAGPAWGDWIAFGKTIKRLYVGVNDPANPRVSVFDADPAHVDTYNKVIGSVGLPEVSDGALVDEVTNRIYVGYSVTGGVAVIDGASDILEAVIPLSGLSDNAEGVIDEGLGRLYVVDAERHVLHVIDVNPASPRFNTVMQSIDVGKISPMWLDVNRNTHQVAISNYMTNTVTVLTPQPVSFEGDSFTLNDEAGNALCAGSIGAADSPFWPGNSYRIADARLGDVDGDGVAEVVTIGNHTGQFPGQVAVFDQSCTLQRRFWHAGHLSSVLLQDINADGTPEIIVGGESVENTTAGVPVVFALDGRFMTADAPEGAVLQPWYLVLNPWETASIRLLRCSGNTLSCNTQADGNGSEYLVGLPEGHIIGSPASLQIAEAVDNTSLSFATGGKAGWRGQASVFHDGGDAAQTGKIAGNQATWLETTVNGPVAGSFWWKVSSEVSYDELKFLVDGVLVAKISGEVGWTQESWRIETPGPHLLRWEYTKDASFSVGVDAGWVDRIEYNGLPSGSVVIEGGAASTKSSTVTLTLSAADADGVNRMRFRNDTDADWAAPVAYAASATWDLSAGDGQKTVFAAFEDLGGTWSAPVSGSIWLDTTNLGDAVDNTALSFVTGGSSGWSGQTQVFHGGGDAARSGTVGDDQVSWFETKVDGPAGSFWWKVSSEQGYDTLRFLIDGKVKLAVSGEVAWRKESWSADAPGSHLLRWEYEKDAAVAHGSDAGWVDEVVVGVPPTGTIVIAGGAGATGSASVTLTLSAADPDGVTEMRFRNEGQADWTIAEPYATSKNWGLSPGDGTKEVFVSFKDGTGLWSGSASDTIGLDTTGPQGGVLVNGGAGGTVNTAVTLSLAYLDANGCSAMQISADGVFDTEPEVACAASAPWTLSAGDGVKTVFARFRDTLGNWSGTASDTIVLDNAQPSVTVTAPLEGATVNRVRFIGGTASDTNLSRVEVQVSDGAMFLTPDFGWSGTPAWLTAEGTEAWVLDTSHVVWANGSYTVTARAADVAGNSAEAETHFSFDASTSAYTMLEMELSSQTILQRETVDISGSLTRLPKTGTSLSGLTITFTVTDPDQEIVPLKVLDDQGAVADPLVPGGTRTYDEDGHFTLGRVAGFTKKGVYTIRATFGGTPALADSASPVKSVLVGDSAGYAIVLEGKVSNGEGLASHNKSANRVYKTLLARGFVDDNIKYFNYAVQPGVDAAPTKAAMQNAIEVWARDRMNAVPAPLYVIMVDHGNPHAFYLGAEILTPVDLDAWLDTLEASLNANALKEKRIVVDGSCYSGSFIAVLSKAGRVIVTSAAGDEQSYKGPNEPDNIRSGEYFLEELFRELNLGHSLREAFVVATERTGIFTRKGGSANDGGKYQDDAAQHPLLDDDGDQVGSNVLSDGSGDGVASGGTYLGVGTGSATVAAGVGVTGVAGNPAEFVSVGDTQHLGPLESKVSLGGTVSLNADVSTAWVEIRKPSKVLAGSGGTGQLEVSIPKEFLMLKKNGRWECGLNAALTGEKCAFVFDESGRYEVFFLTKQKTTGEVTSMKRALVYKDKAGNQAPAAVGLLAPENGSGALTVLMLDWDGSTDPDGDDLTYTVLVSQHSDFSTPDLVREEVGASELLLGVDAGLLDLTTYYWKVIAVDAYGATAESPVWSFTTNNTNPALPGFIQGCATDAVSRARVASPAVRSNYGLVSVSGSCYSIFSSPGPVTITVSANGYTSRSVTATVPSGTSSTVNVALAPVRYDLLVATAGTGVGAVEGAGRYNAGSSVTVRAIPAADSVFKGWGGACAGTAPTATVVMNGNRACTATFDLNRHVLTVSKPGNGSGTVTSLPAGIACGATCTQTIMDRNPVTLSAVASSGSIFAGWGGACAGTAPCSLTINGTTSVAASFMTAQQALTVAKSGNGSGTVTGDKGVIAWQGVNGRASHAYNTVVKLTAAPAVGSEFNGWTGACSGMDPVCAVTMNDAQSVTAAFKLTMQELTVVLQGPGSGVVTLDQGPLSWNANVGTARFEYGTELTLRAQADSGSQLVGWSGAEPGVGDTATLTLLGRSEVTAVFAQSSGVTLSGGTLQVNGRPFTVKGVVYLPTPVGDDPELGPPHGDYFTADYRGLYGADLELLRRMNANTVRLLLWDGAGDHDDFLARAYNGGTDPIYVIAGFWVNPAQDLTDSVVRAGIVAEFTSMIAAHKRHPAILMWAIGNGLNGPGMYGADLNGLGTLLQEMAQAAHAEDPRHPVVVSLADSNLRDAVTALEASASAVDLWGANVYRGSSFGNLFGDYKGVSSKPLVILEYGVDAYSNVAAGPDEASQADYAQSLWAEIVANADACVGATIMEYSDEWWRGRLASAECSDAAAHETCGSSTATQPDGYDNAEWWGIMEVEENPDGPDTLRARAVYGRLQGLFWSSEGAVTINGGAPHTGSRSVWLAIKAPPGAQQMCVGGGGACSAWETTAEEKAWTLETGDGVKTVSVSFKDGAGEIMSGTASDTIVLDTVAPSGGSVTGTAGAAQITLGWSGFSDTTGSGIRGYKVVFGAGVAPASCAVGTVLGTYGSAVTGALHTGLTNQTYGYRVCAIDKVGALSTGAIWSGKPLKEDAAPTGASVKINGDAGWTNKTAVTLALGAVDASLPLKMCISNTATCSLWVPFAASKPWVLAAGSGTKTVFVKFKDAWGNETAAVTDEIRLDTAPPTLGTVSATAGAGTITVTWGGFTDGDGSGVKGVKVVYAKTTPPASCAVGTLLGTFDVPSGSEVHGALVSQTYGYRVCAVDQAGNVSAGVVCSQKPDAKEQSPPAGSIVINGGAPWTKKAAVTLALTAPDESQPVMMCVSNTATCTAWTAFAPTKAWTLAAGNGARTVNVWYRDQWMNATPLATPFSATIGVDTVLPLNGTVTATPGPGQITLDWSGFNDVSSVIGVAPSGIAGYRVVYALKVAPATCAAGTVLSTYDGTGTTAIHAGLVNATYGYRVCAIDKAGNVSAGATKTAKPTASEASAPVGSVQINAGAAVTKSAAVTLTLTATDVTPPIQMCISNTATCTAWVAFAPTKAWTLAAGSGTKTVSVWFRDTWGNATPVASPFTDTIVLDTVAPVNGTVTGTPGDQEIALSWSGFTDPGSGVASYKAVFSVVGVPATCAAGTPVPEIGGTLTTRLHTGLTNGKTYYYRVCAIDNLGLVSTGATWSGKPAP